MTGRGFAKRAGFSEPIGKGHADDGAGLVGRAGPLIMPCLTIRKLFRIQGR
jgi:hypothetical protein